MPVYGSGGTGRTRRRVRRVSRGGHPSRGGTTVGGGTSHHRLTSYRSPTPSVRDQRRYRRIGRPGRGGHPSRGRPTVGGGTRGHRLGVWVPNADPSVPGGRVIPLRQYRRLLRRSVASAVARERDARARGYRGAAQLARASRARPISPQVKEASVLGIGDKDIGRFLKSKVIGRQTPVGGFVGGMKDLAEPGLRDAVSLPANVVVGGYYTGKAGYKAARGDTREARQLWRSFKETDPVALGVQGRFGEAGRQVAKHPLLALLEVSGAGSGASRTAAAVARRAPSAGLRRIGSTRRASRRVEGTNVVERRTYSPGVVGKGTQVAVERTRRRQARKLVQKAEVAERRGDIETADRLHAKALRRDPDRAPDKAIEHQVDLVVEGLGQSIRRPGRAQTGKDIRQALPKKGAELVSLIAQNIVRADNTDLRMYVRELEAEYPRLQRSSPAKAKANRRLRATIQKALASKKLDMGELETAARAYAGVLKPLEKEVIDAQMLEAPEAEMATLKAYAVRNMRHEGIRDDGEALKWPDGRPVTSGEIKTHMRARGIDPAETAFVTHAVGRLGDRAHNVSGRRPQGISRQRRTGAAVLEGTVDAHPERLVEQGVQLRGLADADRTWKRFVSTFAFRKQGGDVVTKATKKDADRVARDLEASTGRGWRPVKLSPWAGRQEQLARLLDDADAEGFVGGSHHPVSEAIERAVAEDADGGGPWAVVPDAAAQRLTDHASVYRTQGPVARTVTQAFRRTVLPLSPSWLTGNAVESAVRTAIRGAGPRSWVTYRRVYNELATGDSSYRRALLHKLPAARRGSVEEALLHMTPGGHFGGTHDTMVHTSARQFEKSKLRPVADAMSSLYRKPGAGTLARAYGRYSDWMFGSFNALIEAQFTRSMAGQFMRKELMDRHRRGLNEKAVEQAARGVRETPEQVAMADYVRRAYGQYDSLSPGMRKAVLTYTPFGMWTWNATKFLYNVLPRDHPVLVGLLAANHQLSEDWRKQHGLDQWAAGAVPPFLQGSIPLPGGGHLRVARFTPFGLMANPLESVAGIVLPQYSGSLMTFRGLDWKGDPLRGPDGEQETDPIKLALLAAKEFAYASVPGLGLGARLIEKGPSTLNPLNPVEPRKGSKAAKDPLEQKLDELDKKLDGGGGDDLDKRLDEIDKALGFGGGAMRPVRFEAGGQRGARLRNRFYGEARRTNDQLARRRAFRIYQRRLRGFRRTTPKFGPTGRNYLPQSRYPVPHTNDRIFSRRRRLVRV